MATPFWRQRPGIILVLLLVAALVLASQGASAQQQPVPEPATVSAQAEPAAPSCTSVGGPIMQDTTWLMVSSPFCVTSSAAVAQGVTLTVEPGVEVRFASGTSLTVNGTLIAGGTEDKPITFTSAAPLPARGDWSHITFTDPSVDAVFDGTGQYLSGSLLRYCSVKYGGAGSTEDWAAVRILRSAPFIDHCIVEESAANGFYLTGSTTRVLGSSLRNNARYGLYAVAAAGDPQVITAVTFTDGLATGNGQGGVRAYTDLGEHGGSVTVQRSTIKGNGGPGVLALASNEFTATDNLIEANTGGGLALTNIERVTIQRNLILNNNHTGGHSYATWGGGIWLDFNGWTPPLLIENNVVTGNNGPLGGAVYSRTEHAGRVWRYNSFVRNSAIGTSGGILRFGSQTAAGTEPDTFAYNTVTANHDYSPTAASMVVSGYPAITNNNFFGNDHQYDLSNANPSDAATLSVANNYWGTTDSAVIASRIYDFLDDITRGLVTYDQPLSDLELEAPVSPPVGVAVTRTGDDISVSWSTNPEGDLAGYRVYYDTDPGYPYAHFVDVASNLTSKTLTALAPGEYYVAVTAYDTLADGTNDWTDGNESWFSVESSVVLPAHISGNVIDSLGAPIAGVLISAGAGLTATTDANGDYTVDLPPGTYNLTATKACYRFLPEQIPLVVGPSQTGKDFVGQGSCISGTVTEPGGAPIQGATISASDWHGSPVFTTTSDVNGSYLLDIPTSWYNLSASKPCYRFSPEQLAVILPPSQTGQGFVGRSTCVYLPLLLRQ